MVSTLLSLYFCSIVCFPILKAVYSRPKKFKAYLQMVFRRETSIKLNFVSSFSTLSISSVRALVLASFPSSSSTLAVNSSILVSHIKSVPTATEVCFRSHCLVGVLVRLLGGFLSDGSSYTGFLPSSKVGMSTRVLSFPFLKCRLQIHVLAFPGKSFLPMLATHLASSGLFDKGSLKTLNASLYLTYYDIQLPHTHAPSRVNRLNTSNSTAQPLK